MTFPRYELPISQFSMPSTEARVKHERGRTRFLSNGGSLGLIITRFSSMGLIRGKLEKIKKRMTTVNKRALSPSILDP